MEHYKNLSLENIEGEVWKVIDWYCGFENIYSISIYGRTKSNGRYVNQRWGKRFIPEKIMKPRLSHGRLRLGMACFNKKKDVNINRLVAIAFLPNPENKAEVCHIDDNPLNNDVENLFWGTHRENMQDSKNKLRHAHGERHGMAKLTNLVISLIRKDLKTMTSKQVRDKYSLSEGAANRIKHKKIWKYVPDLT